MNVRLANAPVSYGAFEITVGQLENVPAPTDVLDAVASAGYVGIDLGPYGYLGSPDEVAQRLAERGLGLAGAFLPLPFSEPERLATEVAEVERVLDVFDLVAQQAARDGAPPRPTLSDAGSALREANPGRGQHDRTLGMDAHGWRRLASGVKRVVQRCRERGYEPSFHHHTASFVEGPWEIDRLLELTDVSLCLDTGHLIACDSDPLQALRDWGSRINHVHLKDARRGVIPAAEPNSSPPEYEWAPRTWRQLGEGELDLSEFLDGLRALGYEGWIVVEQDHIPQAAISHAEVAARQVRNRELLASYGL